MWADFVFGRLLGVERFREHPIDRPGDIDGRVMLDVSCDTRRNLPFLVRRVGAGGRIVGVGYSLDMLERRHRSIMRIVRTEPLPRPRFSSGHRSHHC